MPSLIHLAAEFATAAHAAINQRRKYTGQPYIVHPEAVAKIVAGVTDDEEMICAAWLHDVVEDTPITIGHILKKFGSNIAGLVDDLTNVSQKSDGPRDKRVAIDRAHSSKISPRAKTIKLADVIDNLSGIITVDRSFARRYVRENEPLVKVLREGNEQLFLQASHMVVECKKVLEPAAPAETYRMKSGHNNWKTDR